MKTAENIANIESKEDFLRFVQQLILDCRSSPEQWVNKDLESYFEAMESWVANIEQYYINMKMPVPQKINWRVFADILIAATMYE